MQQCLAKEQNRCVYFTKENKDELLRIEEPAIYDSKREFQIRETETYICIDYCGAYKTFYHYNHWYVEEYHDYSYPKFECYNNEEFQKIYKII